MLVGVVFDPSRQEMFSAERGAGAYLNNRRIRVSAAKRLADSLVATGFPSRKRHQNINIHFYHQMAMATHGVRRGGAASVPALCTTPSETSSRRSPNAVCWGWDNCHVQPL